MHLYFLLFVLEGYDNEGYQLLVTKNAIVIKAVKPIGVIRATQTLAQLAEGYKKGKEAIEAVEITDWAAFKLRGYLHDVGRSFISVDELKKHIVMLTSLAKESAALVEKITKKKFSTTEICPIPN